MEYQAPPRAFLEAAGDNKKPVAKMSLNRPPHEIECIRLGTIGLFAILKCGDMCAAARRANSYLRKKLHKKPRCSRSYRIGGKRLAANLFLRDLV